MYQSTSWIVIYRIILPILSFLICAFACYRLWGWIQVWYGMV